MPMTWPAWIMGGWRDGWPYLSRTCTRVHTHMDAHTHTLTRTRGAAEGAAEEPGL